MTDDKKVTVTYAVDGVVGVTRQFESDAKALKHARNRAKISAEEKGVDMVRDNPEGEFMVGFRAKNEVWIVAIEDKTFFDKLKDALIR